MDFAKFPWDKQDLLIEIRYVHNRGEYSRKRPPTTGSTETSTATASYGCRCSVLALISGAAIWGCCFWCADDLNTTSRLLPSAAGVLNLRPESHGDDSSGWHVDSVELEPYAVADPARQLRVQSYNLTLA